MFSSHVHLYPMCVLCSRHVRTKSPMGVSVLQMCSQHLLLFGLRQLDCPLFSGSLPYAKILLFFCLMLLFQNHWHDFLFSLIMIGAQDFPFDSRFVIYHVLVQQHDWFGTASSPVNAEDKGLIVCVSLRATRHGVVRHWLQNNHGELVNAHLSVFACCCNLYSDGARQNCKNLILLLPSSEKLTTLQIILQVDTNLVMLLFRDPAAAADAMETVKVTQSALSHVPTINYQSLPVWDTCRLEQQQNDTKKITFHYEKSSIFHTQVFTCITERKKQLWKSSMYLIPKSSHEQIPSKTKIKYWHEHA